MSNFNKMFNSVTNTGRANVAKATYGTIALLYIIHRLRKRTKAQCPDCGCPNCASGNAAPGATEGAVAGEQAKIETPCDAEVWKQAIYGDTPDGQANSDENEAKRVSYKVEKGVDLRTVNMNSSREK